MENRPPQNPILYVQPPERFVYLVTHDQKLAATLSQQIIHFGYKIQQVRDFKSLANVTADHRAVAIMVDIPSKVELDDCSAIMAEIKERGSSTSPLVFISERDDQAVRLKAIEVGGIEQAIGKRDRTQREADLLVHPDHATRRRVDAAQGALTGPADGALSDGDVQPAVVEHGCMSGFCMTSGS